MSSVEPHAQRRPRGRPRAFDREGALRRAMDVFWSKGFDNCSMNDLIDAMGINSPSIYAAFGSKENLFREAIGLYAAFEGSITRDALEAHEHGREAIEAMLKRNIEMLDLATAPRGCMVILGTVSVGEQHGDLREFMGKQRQEVAGLVRKRLARAQAEGELAPPVNTDTLATLCLTVLSGLSIQAHDGLPQQALFDAIDAFVSTLPFTSAPAAKAKSRAKN
jgi:AcrR family transcriptional regulator